MPRSYTVRKIEDSDRAKYESWVEAADAHGGSDGAEMTRESLRQWEREQGLEKEALVCPVCGRSWLSPTARGTSRPHSRWDVPKPSWDRVRQLRGAIQALEAELDRELDGLEIESDRN